MVPPRAVVATQESGAVRTSPRAGDGDGVSGGVDVEDREGVPGSCQSRQKPCHGIFLQDLQRAPVRRQRGLLCSLLPTLPLPYLPTHGEQPTGHPILSSSGRSRLQVNATGKLGSSHLCRRVY